MDANWLKTVPVEMTELMRSFLRKNISQANACGGIDEVIQETWASILTRLASGKNERAKKNSTFVLSILRQTLADLCVTREEPMPKDVPDDANAQFLKQNSTLDEKLDAAYFVENLKWSDYLTPREIAVVKQRLWDEISFREMANFLKVSPAWIGMLFERAIEKLKSSIPTPPAKGQKLKIVERSYGQQIKQIEERAARLEEKIEQERQRLARKKERQRLRKPSQRKDDTHGITKFS